ncbi:MAG: ABC transporter substrate-binding protein [Nitriliruptoraceae bacterium]
MAVVLVVGVVLSACGTSAEDADDDPEAVLTEDSPDVGSSDPATRPPSTMLTAYGCPVRTLLPQDSRDTCSTRVVRQLFSGLTEIDAETGHPTLLVASSMDTDDSRDWTVTLHDGWTFQNGESVTARSFVDAWNLAAGPDNELRNRDLFNLIAGYEDVASGDATRLRGLEVVDDLTMRIELTEPFAPLPAKLTDVAFMPLPSVAFEDLTAFANAPVGNGRYELESFDPEREARLRRYEDWAGPDPAANDAVTFVVYSGDNAIQLAYEDVLTGTLDVLDNVPPERLDESRDAFGDRVVETTTSSFTFLGLPVDRAPFDDVNLRRALSLAIDRQRIVDEVFGGLLQPATSVIPPVLDAHRQTACGDCVHDPRLARELLEIAGGWEGPMTVHLNAGSGHERWVRAVTDQWREVLGIEEFIFDTRGMTPYLELLESGDADGPFRLGWALSYPSPEYVLSELFTTSGSGNFFGLTDASVDEVIRQAAAASPGEAIERFQDAEDVVLAHMPLIPLWYGVSTSVHTERVEEVHVDASTILRVERLQLVD